MLKRFLFLVVLIDAVSLATTAQELTAREYARAHVIPNRQSAITLSPPHACTLSKQHPCVYYGGDPNSLDPELNGLSNENDILVPNSYTYTEVNVPVATSISASFSDNVTANDAFDPQTATWFYRTGVSEGNGGTLICSGNSPAMVSENDWLPIAAPQFEVLTTTPCKLPVGNVWFAVTPNCTNLNDDSCGWQRFFEWDTNGLNAINGKYTITANTGMGPTFNSQFFGVTFGSWCNNEGAACGDGMSAGVLK